MSENKVKRARRLDCKRDDQTGLEDAPSSWRIVKLVFLRKPDAGPKKWLRSYRAIALTTVMSKLYATCVILRLEKKQNLKNGTKVARGRY